jgi:hypothetical protein
MAVQTAKRRKSSSYRQRSSEPVPQYKLVLIRYLPAWILLAAVILMLLPGIVSATFHFTFTLVSAIPPAVSGWAQTIQLPAISLPSINLNFGSSSIAPLFTPQVQYWGGHIDRWADEYDLDPNLISTVMQIESCGHPTVSSYAGAQGLFQVMPFHFASDENQLDPETNALRGMTFLQDCMEWADNDPGRAMACYNGGPSVLSKPYELWSNQTQRYYTWGTGIYADATGQQPSSDTLDAWLNAGGHALCDMASSTLGLVQ